MIISVYKMVIQNLNNLQQVTVTGFILYHFKGTGTSVCLFLVVGKLAHR